MIPTPGGGGAGRRRRRFKDANTLAKWRYGQQKYFAKIYRNTPYDAPVRQMGRALMGTDSKSANLEQRVVRNALQYYGPGDYRKMLSRIPQAAYVYGGKYIGQKTGLPFGGSMGAYAGKALHSFVSGYGMNENQLIGGSNKGQISVNEDSLSGDVYITQTEFLQNISATSNAGQPSPFEVVSFPINPGLSSTFPFLSQIAQNYTLYEFDGLVFKFNPTSGENNATSNSLGKVILATNYDPEAPPFVNSVQMENYDYANAAKPSQVIVHGVETKNSQQALNMQYVRTGVSTKSKIFTDIGTFCIATEGVPSLPGGGTQILGELWVTYRIKLSRAQLFGSLLGNNIAADSTAWQSSGSEAVRANPPIYYKLTNTIGVQVANVSAARFSITFPENISLGSYLITVRKEGPADSGHWQNFDSLVHCQAWIPGLTLPGQSPGHLTAPTVGATTNVAMQITTFITVTAPGKAKASLQMGYSTNIPNNSVIRLWIVQVPQNWSLTP